MNNPVLILYLEDDPRDAELVRDKLRQSAMACELRIAHDRAEYEAALAQMRFDLILSDYKLPNYDGLAALALARAKQPDAPFILLSGTLGEEQAVDCVLRGATDYVLKQRLNRLVPAVLRALAEAEDITRRKRAEEASRQQAEQLRGRNEELIRFNRVATGRELRVIELKQQVNDMAAQLGQPQPYPLAFMDAAAAQIVRSTPKPTETQSSAEQSHTLSHKEPSQ